MNIIGKHIALRALEPEDLDYLYHTENHPNFSLFGEPHPPYSKWLLKDYIAQAHKSIYEVQQIRLVIEHRKDHKAIGLIDFNISISNSSLDRNTFNSLPIVEGEAACPCVLARNDISDHFLE